MLRSAIRLVRVVIDPIKADVSGSAAVLGAVWMTYNWRTSRTWLTSVRVINDCGSKSSRGSEEFCGLVLFGRLVFSGGLDGVEYAAAISPIVRFVWRSGMYYSGGGYKISKILLVKKRNRGNWTQLHSDSLIDLTKLVMRIAISKSKGFHRAFQTKVCLIPATTNSLSRYFWPCLQ